MINREYFTIWLLLLGNFKIKTIFDNMIRCGISVEELGCFFDIGEKIMRDFIEYLVSRDRCKFRLALWEG